MAYICKGTYEGDGLVSVRHGNAHAHKAGLVGEDVQFDLTGAKLRVADTNADSIIDATDVLVGDAVIVKARLPKHDPGPQPFAARQLVDQTNNSSALEDARSTSAEQTVQSRLEFNDRLPRHIGEAVRSQFDPKAIYLRSS